MCVQHKPESRLVLSAVSSPDETDFELGAERISKGGRALAVSTQITRQVAAAIALEVFIVARLTRRLIIARDAAMDTG